MNTLPMRFLWFLTHSWMYMKGDRRTFFKVFWEAWRTYNLAMLWDMATFERYTKK